MTPELWQRAKEVLAEAQDLDPGDLESFLDEACKEEKTLRRELASLLECIAPTDDILASGALLRASGGKDSKDGSQLYEGQRIGPYRVERVLDGGGMGTVALAVRQDDFSKQVALKLIKSKQLPEDLSDELLRRFDMERQILARLDHPNIAAIHDGGTTEDGQPYFAMEYVEGEPINRYCDSRKLTIRQRLQLFRQVCTAVQVAHQNLVVHRDLKPGNILVTTDGVPKLIDFGIAKPLSAELAAQGLATAPGRILLTPKYASPEQVGSQSINTATDIYSLGVVLFELLTGRYPYPLESSDFAGFAWAISKVEARKPSTVVRHGPEPDSASAATDRQAAKRLKRKRQATARIGERRRRSRRLAGDLDSIVLKALRKDPRNRYSSAEQFSEDIRRHLAGLPVNAREGTFHYRSTKYVRRNWRRLSAVAVLLLVVAASAIMKIRTDRRLERAELDNLLAIERAKDSAFQAKVLSDLLKKLFVKAFRPDEKDGGPPTAPEVLARGKERIIADLEGDPGLLATQLEAIGMVYEELGQYDEARPLLEDSLRLRRHFYNGDHPLRARGLNNLAALFYRTGDFRRAEILYAEALRMKQRMGQEGVDLAKPMSNLATILMNRGEYAEAERIYERVLLNRQAAYGRDATDVATSLLSLGTLFYVRGDFEPAESRLREALEIRQRAYGPRHTKVANARNILGRIVHAQGRLKEADEHLTAALELKWELLGEDHLQVAFTKKDLAALRLDQGDYGIAESLLAEALEVFQQWRPEDSWEIADAESLLGSCLGAAGRYEEAEPLLHRSYLTLKEQRSEHSIYTRNARRRLRELYVAWGRPFRAVEAQSRQSK